MNNITLAIMAAGMGSRFGGLKQIEPVGPKGETLLDYSVRDAIKAGFSKIVFIIKHEIEDEFRKSVGERIEKIIDVDYAFQSIDDIPVKREDFSGRKKPWGTGQAILSAKSVIDTPFAVINADDFYGREAYEAMGDYLKNVGEYCMTGYRLYDTLSENGAVTRGICEIENGYLIGIEETSGIDKNSGYPQDTLASMNMWGLKTDIFNVLENEFEKFLKTTTDPQKDEFFIPKVMGTLAEKGEKIKVLDANAHWLGMTYREDLPYIKAELLKLKDLY